jgi:APA family basic amino acid/polyamine antiporter
VTQEVPNRNDLARRLGLFDATMVVMGGIVGGGIFVNPHVVAVEVKSPAVIQGVWLLGGLVALLGAFVYAELASLRPDVGGQYAYVREAFHPMVAFVYGWGLLLVTQSGGMAFVAILFAHHFQDLARVGSVPVVATLSLALLTAINCLGVKAGSNVQSALMILKIAAIAALVAAGLFVAAPAVTPLPKGGGSADSFASIGAAMVPVLFAYGGWQTASFVAGELKRPERDLPRGLFLGVLGVIALYCGVSFVCLRVLGPEGLAKTQTPALDVMRRAFGEAGGVVIALGISVSTLGFLSQGILTAPRVYYAMARDGVFFDAVGRLDPRTQAPVVAIILQGVVAAVIALSGRYEQILNYVVSVDFIFFGLTGAALIVLRRRDRDLPHAYKMPGHPFTTLLFVVTCWAVALNTFHRYPENTLIGAAILLSGIPVYFLWRRRPG